MFCWSWSHSHTTKGRLAWRVGFLDGNVLRNGRSFERLLPLLAQEWDEALVLGLLGRHPGSEAMGGGNPSGIPPPNI